jgi:hypothetical protein
MIGFKIKKVSAGSYVMWRKSYTMRVVAIDNTQGGWVTSCSWTDMKTAPLKTFKDAKEHAVIFLDTNISKIAIEV